MPMSDFENQPDAYGVRCVSDEMWNLSGSSIVRTFLSIPTALPFTKVVPNPDKHTLRITHVNKARRIGRAKIHYRSPLLLKLVLISRMVLIVYFL